MEQSTLAWLCTGFRDGCMHWDLEVTPALSRGYEQFDRRIHFHNDAKLSRFKSSLWFCVSNSLKIP